MDHSIPLFVQIKSAIGAVEQDGLQFWLFVQVIIVPNRGICWYQPSFCKMTIFGWVDTVDCANTNPRSIRMSRGT